MKRIILTLAVICLALTGCNGDVVEPPVIKEELPTSENPIQEGYVFELNGTKIAVDGNMADIYTALGEPASYFESESCAFQGLDKVYTYGSVVVRTYPESNADYVLSIEIKDDSVSTPEGISIGDTADGVKAVYGEPSESTASALIYEKGNSLLTFLTSDSEVTAITYTRKQ